MFTCPSLYQHNLDSITIVLISGKAGDPFALCLQEHFAQARLPAIENGAERSGGLIGEQHVTGSPLPRLTDKLFPCVNQLLVWSTPITVSPAETVLMRCPHVLLTFLVVTRSCISHMGTIFSLCLKNTLRYFCQCTDAGMCLLVVFV